MNVLSLTNAYVSPAVVGDYFVDVSIRYGTSGPFTLVATNIQVHSDGTLVTPLYVNVDYNINPEVQFRVVYTDCDSNAYVESYVMTTTTSTTTTSTTTTTTAFPFTTTTTTTSTTTTTTLPPTTTTTSTTTTSSTTTTTTIVTCELAGTAQWQNPPA